MVGDPTCWFYTSANAACTALAPGAKDAFAVPPAQLRYGTSGRNILRAPGVWNTDLNITREFTFKERLKSQFRAEFYNAPNTSHFNGPASTSVTGGSNFMSIRSSYGERQVRFALRLQW